MLENNNLIVFPRTGYSRAVKNMNGSFVRDMPGKKSGRPMDPLSLCGCGTIRKNAPRSYSSYIWTAFSPIEIIEMRSQAEIKALLREMLPELSVQYHVRKIGIFGSYSKDCQTPKNDLDLVVEFDQPIGMFAFVPLMHGISDRLGTRVDLVTPSGLHPLIRDQVMSEVVYV